MARPRSVRSKPSGNGELAGPILVTGASGFLGRHVVRTLADRGVGPLRALQRRPRLELGRLGVEQVEGSVLDPRATARACEGMRHVIHLAGRVSRGAASGDQELFDLHVKGARSVLEAAAGADVQRVVHVSTSGTVAVSRDSAAMPGGEAPFAMDVVRRWPYYLSKVYAERVALEAVARDGRDVVIVSPSLLLGPGDEDLSSTQDVLRFLRREIPVVPSGGLSCVDVRDAAEMVVEALARGRSGARYLIGAENLDFGSFFNRLSRVSGCRGPSLRVPGRAAPLAARALAGLESVLGMSGEEAASVDMAGHYWYLDSRLARDELGFAPRPLDGTLRDTVEWLLDHPHLRPKRGLLGLASRGLRLGGNPRSS